MNILVINCGSSSLKYQLIDSVSEQVLAKGLCERIGGEGACITHTPAGGAKRKDEIPMPDHNAAIQAVIDHLLDPVVGVVSSLDEIGAVGHRIVHGGEKFNKAVLINDEVVRAIGEVSDLAPLHNPANLIGIHACERLMPGVPMVAVFDTAFHQTMAPEAYLYAIPLSTTRTIRFAVTASTAPATTMFPRELLRSSARREKISVSLSATSATALP